MRRSRGFTLIELIMVIMLLGIIATVSVQFVRLSTEGALDLARWQRWATTAAVLSEQFSRQVREALPGSVRATADGRCLELIPVLAGGTYLDLPVAAPASSFRAVALPTATPLSGRVAVYTATSANVYVLSSPGPISTPLANVPVGSGEINVTFAAAASHQFPTDSPTRRFYLVGEPVSWCQSGSFLYRYSNYGFFPAVTSLPGSLPTSWPQREVASASLKADSLRFSVTPPSLVRNGLVTLNLILRDANSTDELPLAQEVQIRNVP